MYYHLMTHFLSQGKVVYANYGRIEDLKYLNTANVNVKDSVVLMRTGYISLAEKVRPFLNTLK